VALDKTPPITAAAGRKRRRQPLPDVEERGRQMLDSLPELSRPRPGAIFDQPEAQAFSCYAAILPPKDHSDPHHQHLLRVVPPGKLWPEKGDQPIPPLGETAHDQLRATILNEYFPCIGARAAFAQGTYRFGYYKELGHLSSMAAMGRDLRRFVTEYEQLGDFSSFIAVFKYPQNSTETSFETLLWRHLQMLHDNDINEWDPHYSPNPTDANFAFSFFGKAFFVVGMHPGASRFARRITFNTLVFNPESQIRRLKEEGILQRFAHTVRERDTLYQGCPNPSLPAETDTSGGEARVYSGRLHVPGDGWVCPFKPRANLVTGGRAECADRN
jgi:FPC/CPF motif-containing protein YcgG